MKRITRAERLKRGGIIDILVMSDFRKIKPEKNKRACNVLEKDIGLKVRFGAHCKRKNIIGSCDTKMRIADFHLALKNSNVNLIQSFMGGFNVNEMLPFINWKTIIRNPKIICGTSDITVLLNAIYAKTGLITYLGPNFTTFAAKYSQEYSIEYFKKCLISSLPYFIYPSEKWIDMQWFEKKNVRFKSNKGFVAINNGKAEGTLIGGNLCSLNLLQGTQYMPSLRNSILFLEEDDLAGEHLFKEFNRNLESLLQQPDAKYIRGVVFGRFQSSTKITINKLNYLVQSKKILRNIPVIANVDMGHTNPIATFPIGGRVIIIASKEKSTIKIITH